MVQKEKCESLKVFQDEKRLPFHMEKLDVYYIIACSIGLSRKNTKPLIKNLKISLSYGSLGQTKSKPYTKKI